jgi:hypothetical protein
MPGKMREAGRGRDGVVVPQPENRGRHDRTIFGWKTMAEAEPERAQRETRNIFLNKMESDRG